MTNDTARTAAGETHAHTNPKQGRNPRPQPPMRCAAPAPALPEPIDAQDLRIRINEIGIHWWSIIDSVLSSHEHREHVHPQPLEPLPQWAVDRLKDQGRHNNSEVEFSQASRLLKDWLHLAVGNGSQYRYEVWTSKGGRLSIRHESLTEAAEVLDRLKPEHPGAFIARVHVLSGPPFGQALNPDLLDTLIGRVDHIGTAFADDEDEYTVQDETGRQVSVKASTLRQHQVYDRLTKRGKESLDHYLAEYKSRKEAIRKAAAERKAGEQP